MSATRQPPRSPWREPVRGGHPSAEQFSLSGAEILRSMLAGAMPRPPLSRLTGMQLTEIGEGQAEFQMPLSGWLRSPQGAISIGPLTIPADAAMACAIQTVLPAATLFTTSELSLRLLRPAPVGGAVTARGRLIEARRTIALADAELRDGEGALIAHGSSLCRILQPADARALVPQPPDPGADAPAADDPWQRPAPGEVIPQEVWDRLSGLEVLRAQIGGELPKPPIHYLTGLDVREASEGAAVAVIPASRWLCAPPPGRVQGGVVATLAETALSSAIQTLAPAGTAIAPIDLKINYLRPLAADGAEATATGTVVHAGRRTAVATAEVRGAGGKAIAIATGSAMLLPGRPASLGAAEG